MSNLAQKLNRLALVVKRLLREISNKVDVADFNQFWKGTHSSDIALNIAHPTAEAGSYALVDSGVGEDAIFYWFDADEGWITNGDSVSLSSTDALVEGSSNLYFTNARAISAVTSTINAAIAASLEPTINPQTGTSYTIGTVGTDNNGKTILHMDNVAANTPVLTSAQTMPISICQFGAGVTTITAGAGVTAITGNLVFSARYQTKTIYRVNAGVYNVVG
jgi:hypothetical protein